MRICQQCDIELGRWKQKFCSSACSDKYYKSDRYKKNKKTPRHTFHYKNWVCDCPEGWIIPKQYNTCANCNTRDHLSRKVNSTIVIPI